MSLDRLLFVISNVPWQKAGTRQITPAADRADMVRAAIAGHAGFEVSTAEIDRGGNSYTVDTVEELRRSHPDADLHLLVGADAAAGIPTWERYRSLAGLVTVVVVDRSDAPEVSLEGFSVRRVDMPRLDISSTEIRHRLAVGAPVDWLVPEGVLHIIRERLLYREGT